MMCLVNKTYLDIICSLNIYVYRNALMFIYDIYICYMLSIVIVYYIYIGACDLHHQFSLHTSAHPFSLFTLM
jgi:hypothetical protein